MDFSRRISAHERDAAVGELHVFFERGFIDKTELKDRKGIAQSAQTIGDIEVCLADLRAGYRTRETRVTDQERESARRRLKIHLAEGQIEPGDYARRDRLVSRAISAAEISDALAELPQLKPAREHRDDRLASQAERERAMRSLKEAYDDGRLELREFEERIEMAAGARSREEIHAAFRGIPQHRIGQPRETVKGAARVATRAGIALARTAVIMGWLCACLLIVLVWLVGGTGAAIPVVLIALVSTASLLLLLRVPRRNRG